jgi:hypothetical protein
MRATPLIQAYFQSVFSQHLFTTIMFYRETEDARYIEILFCGIFLLIKISIPSHLPVHQQYAWFLSAGFFW